MCWIPHAPKPTVPIFSKPKYYNCSYLHPNFEFKLHHQKYDSMSMYVILNEPTHMLHRNDNAFDCGIKSFFCKTPLVMATYVVNDSSDIDGLPHLGKTNIVINKSR